MLEDKRISSSERREQKNNKDFDQHSYLNLYLYFFLIMQIFNTNFAYRYKIYKRILNKSYGNLLFRFLLPVEDFVHIKKRKDL